MEEVEIIDLIHKVINENSVINLIRDLGLISVITMGFVFLSKSLVKYFIDKKIEEYKADAEQRSINHKSSLDSIAEVHKSSLQLLNFKATKLHEKRLDNILLIHNKMVDLNMKMHELTAEPKPEYKDYESEEKERIENAANSFNDFLKTFEDKKIFLSKDLADKISAIKDDYRNAYNDYTFEHRTVIKNKATAKMAIDAARRVRNVLDPSLEELEKEFRKILGSNS